jgi:hypothetical protein
VPFGCIIQIIRGSPPVPRAINHPLCGLFLLCAKRFIPDEYIPKKYIPKKYIWDKYIWRVAPLAAF